MNDQVQQPNIVEEPQTPRRSVGNRVRIDTPAGPRASIHAGDTAEALAFDNADTTLISVNPDAAIKEVNTKVDNIPPPTAANVSFNPTQTSITAETVQAGIEQLDLSKMDISDFLARAVDNLVSTRIDAYLTANQGRLLANQIAGLSDQIDGIAQAYATVPTRAALNTSPPDHTQFAAVYVIADETQGGATTKYVWGGTSWIFLLVMNDVPRNFTTNPITPIELDRQYMVIPADGLVRAANGFVQGQRTLNISADTILSVFPNVQDTPLVAKFFFNTTDPAIQNNAGLPNSNMFPFSPSLNSAQHWAFMRSGQTGQESALLGFAEDVPRIFYLNEAHALRHAQGNGAGGAGWAAFHPQGSRVNEALIWNNAPGTTVGGILTSGGDGRVGNNPNVRVHNGDLNAPAPTANSSLGVNRLNVRSINFIE